MDEKNIIRGAFLATIAAGMIGILSPYVKESMLRFIQTSKPNTLETIAANSMLNPAKELKTSDILGVGTKKENPVETYVLLANGSFGGPALAQSEEDKKALEELELAYQMFKGNVNHETLLIYNPDNWHTGINESNIAGEATLPGVLKRLEKLTYNSSPEKSAPDETDRTYMVFPRGARGLKFAGEALTATKFNDILSRINGSKIIITTNGNSFIRGSTIPRAVENALFISFYDFRDFYRIWNENPDLPLETIIKKIDSIYQNSSYKSKIICTNAQGREISFSESLLLKEPFFLPAGIPPETNATLSLSSKN